jgi:hypothetical protein
MKVVFSTNNKDLNNKNPFQDFRKNRQSDRNQIQPPPNNLGKIIVFILIGVVIMSFWSVFNQTGKNE